jgi:GalNAc-alpha-(1->4)-GalNAc-alpha-(1->3)-diNAcBac-PP-undecaprenol alpha-1,4-N-acetyl-D-galactosaminyltransferase
VSHSGELMSEDRLHLVLVIPSLSSGGAERVLSTMANYWAERGHEINILTLDDGAEPPFYQLHPSVNHRPLGVAGQSGSVIAGIINNLRRILVLRHAIRETSPHVIISFTDQTNVVTVLATVRFPAPVIVAERIDPRYQPIGWGWELLRRWTYRRAAHLVAQTPGAMTFFSSAMQRRGSVIPNPVQPPRLRSSAGRADRQPTIITIGRLSAQKGFDVLIRAFAQIAPRHAEWAVQIWGEGPLRDDLEMLVGELGLEARVQLPGRTTKVTEKLCAADLFVLSSRYEGFPNALCEAMACGLPVISFDCPSGPRAIIRDGIDGVLVRPGDVDALAAAMDRLMADESERRRLSARAPEVLDRFGVEKVMRMWEDLIREVVT